MTYRGTGQVALPLEGVEKPLPHAGWAILTPPAELAALRAEVGAELYDPCPWPRPLGYDGLTADWGPVSYVNPLFWGGGITAWVRKAIYERDKGKTVIMALPVDGWVRLLIEACGGGDNIRYKPDWRWGTPEGEWKKPSRPLLLWVLRPR